MYLHWKSARVYTLLLANGSSSPMYNSSNMAVDDAYCNGMSLRNLSSKIIHREYREMLVIYLFNCTDSLKKTADQDLLNLVSITSSETKIV